MLTGSDARIAAVLDWELCTLGDPLADLGYLMNNWAEPGESGPESRGAALAPTVAGGFPSRREMLAHYRELTGRDVSQVDYYRAFSYWRLAAIVEGVLARYLKGVMGKAGRHQRLQGPGGRPRRRRARARARARRARGAARPPRPRSATA